jgi:hypothetical protein
VRGDDRSLDTQLYTRWSHSLEISVLGNLKLVPRFDTFWYMNKVKHDVFTAFQTTLNLQYRFDWRLGLPVSALKYARPEPQK